MNKTDVSIYHPASINSTIEACSMGIAPLTCLYIVLIISLIIMYFYFTLLDNGVNPSINSSPGIETAQNKFPY